jgi:kynureninase
MHAIRTKSLALSKLFRELVAHECGEYNLRCVSPVEPGERGSQLSFAHGHAYAIMQAIIERGVIGDFRQPDLMRFGFTPLYVRFVDCWDAVAVIRDVMSRGEWQDPKYHQRNTVT